MMIYFTKTLSVEKCKKYPDYFFVFGDNLAHQGTAGQAVIRHEPNSIGVPTKVAPCMEERCFFSDQDDEKLWVRMELERIFKMHLNDNTIVLPEDPIGSGLAELETRSPEIWKMIQDFYKWAKGAGNGILPE